MTISNESLWWKDSKSYFAAGYKRRDIKRYCAALRKAGLRYKVLGHEIRLPLAELWEATEILIDAGDDFALRTLPFIVKLNDLGQLLGPPPTESVRYLADCVKETQTLAATHEPPEGF
jgi:hypothetical protein